MPWPKREVRVRVAADVELHRAVEDELVAVGRALPDEHLVARRDGVAAELGGRGRGAPLRRRRRRPAQHLLDRGRQQAHDRRAARRAGRAARSARAGRRRSRCGWSPSRPRTAGRRTSRARRRRAAAGRRRPSVACTTTESMSSVGVGPLRGDERRRRTRASAPAAVAASAGSKTPRRPRGCRSRARPPRTARGGPPRARRAGCRSPASAARPRPRARKSTLDAVLDCRRAARGCAGAARPRAGATIRGVRPVLTSRRIRAWRGSSIMFSTIPATVEVLEQRAAVAPVAAPLGRVGQRDRGAPASDLGVGGHRPEPLAVGRVLGGLVPPDRAPRAGGARTGRAGSRAAKLSRSVRSMSARSATGTRGVYASASVDADPLLVGADLVLDRRDDRWGVLPVGDAVLLQRDRVPVLVDLGPVRVVQLVQREAGVAASCRSPCCPPSG